MSLNSFSLHCPRGLRSLMGGIFFLSQSLQVASKRPQNNVDWLTTAGCRDIEEYQGWAVHGDGDWEEYRSLLEWVLRLFL